jgi:hypothetical protein
MGSIALKRFLRASFLFLPALLCAGAAHATGSLRELRPLTFGQVAVTGGGGETVTVAPDGSLSHSAGVTLLLPRGSPGMYELTGYTPSTSLWLSIADNTIDRLAGGASFSVGNFQFSPACTLVSPCATDGAGKLDVTIGATLTTQNATTYDPGPYRGTYTLMLNF